MSQSFAVACLPQLFIHWTPPNERSRLLLLAIAGAHLGTALNYPLSGFLAFHYGWEAVFYVTGNFFISPGYCKRLCYRSWILFRLMGVLYHWFLQRFCETISLKSYEMVATGF